MRPYIIAFLAKSEQEQKALLEKGAKRQTKANAATVGRYESLIKEFEAWCKRASVAAFPITYQKADEYMDFRAAEGAGKGTVNGLDSITKALAYFVEVRVGTYTHCMCACHCIAMFRVGSELRRWVCAVAVRAGWPV